MFVAQVKEGTAPWRRCLPAAIPGVVPVPRKLQRLALGSESAFVAAQLRGDIGDEDLAQQQAQWLIGRNPFSSSIMYGEGYDWTPLYSVRSGQMVGAIPVGIETKGDADIPYWPNQICWTYKEVWTQPAGEWIWLMRDLNGPAVCAGSSIREERAPLN